MDEATRADLRRIKAAERQAKREAEAAQIAFEEGQTAALTGRSKDDCRCRSGYRVAAWHRGYEYGRRQAAEARMKNAAARLAPAEVANIKKRLAECRRALTEE
jgi:hypothetical protein